MNLSGFVTFKHQQSEVLNININLSGGVKSNMNLSGFVTFKHQQSEVLNININLSGGAKNNHQPVSEFLS
jgi:hypothetical protein